MRIPDFGPVYIKEGPHKGRIGNFDDESYDPIDEKAKAVVLFGHGFLASKSHLISYDDILEINSNILLKRREQLVRAINLKEYDGKKISQSQRMSYLEEIELVHSLLSDRLLEAMFKLNKGDVKIFLSHSSLDKEFVTPLAVDLKSYGFDVWLDEWEIFAGESIPTRISEGIKECQFVLLILSPNSVKSKWVETEWQAKYWEEIESGNIKLIPVLIDECEIPTLLKTKKYIDFTKDYSFALEDICLSINKLKNG